MYIGVFNGAQTVGIRFHLRVIHPLNGGEKIVHRLNRNMANLAESLSTFLHRVDVLIVSILSISPKCMYN